MKIDGANPNPNLFTIHKIAEVRSRTFVKFCDRDGTNAVFENTWDFELIFNDLPQWNVAPRLHQTRARIRENDSAGSIDDTGECETNTPNGNQVYSRLNFRDLSESS